MADPIEKVAEVLNEIASLPQVYADQALQGASPPYIVITRINPRLSRYFGGAFQLVDFQIAQHYVDYSETTVETAKTQHQIISDALELSAVDGLTSSIAHRLTPYRVNIDDGNHFSIVQTWQIFFEET
jgi:hypothetical protein